MKKTNVTTKPINAEPLVLMASMYDEYMYLDEVFVKNHQCLFGVKAELYNTVKADLDKYEGAYIMYQAALKKYSNQCRYTTNSRNYWDTRLLSWGELLYGEGRWNSSKERKQYGIKEYKPKYRRY